MVILTEIPGQWRFADTFILTCHMVGDKVDDYLQSGLMATGHQTLKLLHAPVHLVGKVRVNVIIVGDGIGRAGHTLHHLGVLTGDAIL